MPLACGTGTCTQEMTHAALKSCVTFRDEVLIIESVYVCKSALIHFQKLQRVGVGINELTLACTHARVVYDVFCNSNLLSSVTLSCHLQIDRTTTTYD